MNIVGLGQCGCNIAEKFNQYPQYEVYLFDSEERTGKNARLLKEQNSHKDYEEKFPKYKFKPKHDETIFICATSGTITGAALRLLHHFKKTEIRLVMILPDQSEMLETYALHHKLIFNALQDYARSGMLKDVVLISNEILEETIPNLTFLNKYDKINEVISYSLHTINVFENTKPVSKTKIDHKDHCRILSLGSYDYKINEENMYFSLDNVIESVYYISIPQKTLEEDFELVKLIKDNFREKNSSSYQVYSNNSDYDYGIVVKRTHFHQGQLFT